jgi:hypothetical protein
MLRGVRPYTPIPLYPSEYPVAYTQTGHASVSTHDIFVIFGDKAYRIRLPVINSFTAQNWQEAFNEQKAALKDMIASLRPKNT